MLVGFETASRCYEKKELEGEYERLEHSLSVSSLRDSTYLERHKLSPPGAPRLDEESPIEHT